MVSCRVVSPCRVSQCKNHVNSRLLPSQTSVAAAYPGSTRRRPQKRKRWATEDDEHSNMCRWKNTCITRVHPDHLRDHLRVHIQGIDARCGYPGCNKVLRKEGLARHYLTHFGTRVECCGCGRDFARPDEIARGHRRNDKIRYSSKRWKRFIIDGGGNRNYL